MNRKSIFITFTQPHKVMSANWNDRLNGAGYLPQYDRTNREIHGQIRWIRLRAHYDQLFVSIPYVTALAICFRLYWLLLSHGQCTKLYHGTHAILLKVYTGIDHTTTGQSDLTVARVWPLCILPRIMSSISPISLHNIAVIYACVQNCCENHAPVVGKRQMR